MSEVDRPGDGDFLPGGGEVGARTRAFDWATTPLGPPEGWPQTLKDAVASHVSGAIVNAAGGEDERRRAEAARGQEALAESEARLRAVIEEAPLAIALTERSGEILLRNPRFDQARGRNGNHGGLGIGLTLARQLVEMHGGSIEAHSEGEGQGAEFGIRLPLAVANAPSTEPPRPPKGHRQPARLKVLVVDDNVDLVEMLSMVVESAGHHVRKAFDGRSGISAALDYQPDLILLDVGLPDLNGVEVAKELRRHAEAAATRIVAFTGWGQPEDRQRTADAGFNDHLTKPADPEQIERILKEVAGRVPPADGRHAR